MKKQSQKSRKEPMAMKITNFALNIADNAVGKSLPLLVHEVKLPEEIRNRNNQDVFSM